MGSHSVALLFSGELRTFLPDGWRSANQHVLKVLKAGATVASFLCASAADAGAGLPDEVVSTLWVVMEQYFLAFSQFERLAICFALTCVYEREHKVRFTHYIRARPDQIWHAHMPPLSSLGTAAISLRVAREPTPI